MISLNLKGNMPNTMLPAEPKSKEPPKKSERSPIMQSRNLVKVYKTGAGEFAALKGINLEVYEGEFLGIVGKSGAGKTTLLNTLSGVSEITSGEVTYKTRRNGNSDVEAEPISLNSLDEDELAVWRGQNIGIVYQSFELMPQLDLVDNILLPQDFPGFYRSDISSARAYELLEMVGLTEHALKLPAHISGGQKQRVAIARALVNDPAVIMADEPTGNLDSVTAENILKIFRQLVEHGKTIVMVTHDQNLLPRFSRYLHISDGEVIHARIEQEHSRNWLGVDSKIIGDKNAGSKSDILVTVATNYRNSFEDPLAMPVAKDLLLSETDSTSIVQAGGDRVANSQPRHASLRQPMMVNDQSAILLNDVVKIYKNAAGEFPALKGVNLRINYGQFISIVGKSGSGKSTLLNMLTGIDYPTSGEVIVGDVNIYKMSESKRSLWRGRNIGVVFQFFQLLPMLTLLENTMLPMDYCNMYPAVERPDRALELLEMVGLKDYAHSLPGSVSSGQQQSAAIARSLATDPPIIVADEPTGNLDTRSADQIINLFRSLAYQGKTVLIVTHDPLITSRTDQTVIISDGEIIDDVVARALPLLNHPHMLEVTHAAEKRFFSPGSIILRQGDPVTHFFMVANGEVDVLLTKPDGSEINLARLGKGQFFGEVELLKGGNSLASVRAAGDNPVEVALLDKDQFNSLLGKSPSIQDELMSVANTRIQENRSQTK